MIFRTVLVFLVLSFGSAFAAGGGGGGSDDSSSDALYKSSVSLIKRAGKLCLMEIRHRKHIIRFKDKDRNC